MRSRSELRVQPQTRTVEAVHILVRAEKSILCCVFSRTSVRKEPPACPKNPLFMSGKELRKPLVVASMLKSANDFLIGGYRLCLRPTCHNVERSPIP